MKSPRFRPRNDAAAAAGATACADPWGALDEEHGKRDSWLLSYIDILTLFLTLVVVLLALQPAREGPPAAADPAGLVFASPEPIERRSPPPPPDRTEPDPEAAVAGRVPDPPAGAGAGEPPETALDAAHPLSLQALLDRPLLLLTGTGPAQAIPPAGESAPAETAVDPGVDPGRKRERLVQRFITSLPQGLDERVKISPLPGGIHFEMRDNILFAPGSAELTGEGSKLLNDLARLFLEQNGVISVEGHSDDRPIANTRFPSNWELSSGRANRVTRYLIDKGVDRARLRAVGYADTRPLENNDSPEGRARNRRVALIMEIPGS